jgi:hypothetical protein
MIPTYLSHSYRPEDRELNRLLCDYFWDRGFAFTVDPKSSVRLSIPHLELMMQRSACFVAIVPYREEEERYRTSPYIVFEHRLAVRARKPLVVIAAPQVAGHPFDDDRLCVVPRGGPDIPPKLDRLVGELKVRSLPYARDFDHVLGTVGLVLPRGRHYHPVARAVRQVLEAAGYRVHALPHDADATQNFAELDRHDFFVVDIAVKDLPGRLYYRFAPTIKLGYRRWDRPPIEVPRLYRDDALERVGGSGQNVIWWSDIEELTQQLVPVVDKMQRPRRQFRSREEGAGYFESLGRPRHGPVFVSNADEQNEFARRLSRALDLKNIGYFHYRYRNTIPLGIPWEQELMKLVDSSALFVALTTADYWKSDLCRRELSRAAQPGDGAGPRIYRYYLDRTSDPTGRVDRLQARDLADVPEDAQIDAIVRDIERYLTDGPAAARSA